MDKLPKTKHDSVVRFTFGRVGFVLSCIAIAKTVSPQVEDLALLVKLEAHHIYVNSATLLWKSALSQLYFFAGTRKPDSGGTYGERQRASRQSNFGKRRGGKDAEIAVCFSVIY